MIGCEWKDDKCIGSFTPPKCKKNMHCIYVYPSTKSHDKPNGTIQAPFKTLTRALNHTNYTEDSIIYGLNLPN